MSSPLVLPDIFVGPLVSKMLDCLCTAVNLNPNPPQNCCLRIGTEVTQDAAQYEDLCCQGLGYVLLGDMYPSSTSFPSQDIIRQANTVCSPPAWAVELKAGIIRCAPTGDGFNFPHCDEWNEAAIQNIYDAQSLRRAACCFRDFIVNNDDLFAGMSVVMERQTQGPVQGGCVERSFSMAVQIPNCDCP